MKLINFVIFINKKVKYLIHRHHPPCGNEQDTLPKWVVPFDSIPHFQNGHS